MRNRKETGYFGELCAAKAMMGQGYRLVERNYTIRGGEIDLIMAKEGELVFVEVKTRRGNDFGTALESITPQKRRHLLHAAETYLCHSDHHDDDIRFFAVAVLLDEGDRVIRTEIYKDIFS